MSLLRRSGQQALQALLALAEAPQQWRSVSEIAAAQDLPAPMLEQLLLQLRRAGLVEARRGRLGGYRLNRRPGSIQVAEVLAAVGAQVELIEPEAHLAASRAEQQVLRSMASRLQRAMERELVQFTLEELLFDLRSCRETLSGDGGLMLG
jgi:Rrf2 family iron-sulfur cluster assembly transcriptional regulator